MLTVCPGGLELSFFCFPLLPCQVVSPHAGVMIVCLLLGRHDLMQL